MSFVTRYLDPALVERLNYLQVTARSVVEGSITGAHRSPLKGASVEFRQHRFYTPDEETNLRAALLLDASGSMGYAGKGGDTKFEYGCKVVAALAYLMLGQTESV